MLKFYHSPMGGGKSAILIAKASLNPKHSVVFKPALDTRDGDNIVASRNGSSLIANVIDSEGFDETYELLIAAIKTAGVLKKAKQKFVFIDEAQFLTEEQVNALLKISLKCDIIIECYGLLVDFKSKLFEGSKRLVEVADEIEGITAYGTDGEIARQNARVIDGEIQFEGEQVVLGKEETYKSISNKEYFIRGGYFDNDKK